MNRLRSLTHNLTRIQRVGIIMLVIAGLVALVGYLNQHQGIYLGQLLGNLLTDYYANISTELASIAITVLIIDYLVQKREVEREKRDLILQMGSPDNAFATEAVRKLRARGWGFGADKSLLRAVLREADLSAADLENIRLEGAKLWGVNLAGANLKIARLEGADLERADLQGANLWGANLEGANLVETNLRGADLRLADLEGADLKGANLENAKITEEQLSKAKSLADARQPDGKLDS